MTYLKDEVLLLQSVINNSRNDIKQALNNLLDAYNKVYVLAVNQQKYINKKRPEYAKEMEDNFRLVERNKYLEDSVKRYKELNKSQIKYSKELEKDLRTTKNLLEYYEKKSNSKK